MDNTGDISEDEGTRGSKAGERGGERGTGIKVSVVSTLVDDIGFRDRAPILGSKLAGRLDFGP